ncbi:hypothetical protein HAN_2g243 (nucleomorph) [Hemiselmis andersenii]|uniref:Uncharacterized protein n=1 Tax=Hemiselmis andersenii TaxID=464988 RepID=A9BKR4_HEMAN|nr:hypothetical protein HAN_2g243 [Hemiselmis andersenii]ABW98069.1 hypothetical protein HAN_2g243 [Hemiselmis andersenii]
MKMKNSPFFLKNFFIYVEIWITFLFHFYLNFFFRFFFDYKKVFLLLQKLLKISKKKNQVFKKNNNNNLEKIFFWKRFKEIKIKKCSVHNSVLKLKNLELFEKKKKYCFFLNYTNEFKKKWEEIKTLDNLIKKFTEMEIKRKEHRNRVLTFFDKKKTKFLKRWILFLPLKTFGKNLFSVNLVSNKSLEFKKKKKKIQNLLKKLRKKVFYNNPIILQPF